MNKGTPLRLFDAHLNSLESAGAQASLTRLQRGIEKESLRVTPEGDLSALPHPPGLGSALTHPHITTDFSESQPELITQVHNSVAACLDELHDIHGFVYQHTRDELLWAASMPCVLGNDDDVPVGRYGSSNIGLAKTIYRLGLSVRYGRSMQLISGLHYNFSLPEDLWPVLAGVNGTTDSRDFRTDAYFGLIRNFRRHSWLLLYLFGASPALCKSFMTGRPSAVPLEDFDENSLYLPHATTLRMGRLGYQSDAQAELHVSYNSLREYADTIRAALTETYPAYEQIGVKRNGEYQQLSTTLLQIENEFYGTIRPKRPVHPGERPLIALHDRGVEYVEVRCLDLNPFEPAGIDAETIRFMDVFLLHCLLTESPPDSRSESAAMQDNQLAVVEEGRRPGLALNNNGQEVELASWAVTLIEDCTRIAARLDQAHGGTGYASAVAEQRAKVAEPGRTASARILETMRSEQIPFFRFAMNRSIEHRAYFRAHPLEASRADAFTIESQQSIEQQQAMEAADGHDFDAFLAEYLNLPDFR
jgi:glutamate--cysteine ligase